MLINEIMYVNMFYHIRTFIIMINTNIDKFYKYKKFIRYISMYIATKTMHEY